MSLEIILQFMTAALIALGGYIMKNLNDDIREARVTLKEHINDHPVHCKHPMKGC